MIATDRYSPGERVRVVFPGDPHHGDEATVEWSYADGGDMVHVLAFSDGTRGHYLAAELVGRGVGPLPGPPHRPASPPRPLVRRGPEPDVPLPPTAAGSSDLTEP